MTSKLPARTEGALWLLHLYGKPATAKELRDRNHAITTTYDPDLGYSRYDFPEGYEEVFKLMMGPGDTNPFWFADGIMYGLEQAFMRGLVSLADNQDETVNEYQLRDFLKDKRSDRHMRAPFRRSRIRYQLSGLGYMWLTGEARRSSESQD